MHPSRQLRRGGTEEEDFQERPPPLASYQRLIACFRKPPLTGTLLRGHASVGYPPWRKGKLDCHEYYYEEFLTKPMAVQQKGGH
eukprot:s352_g9.t1